MTGEGGAHFTTRLLDRSWLSKRTFQIELDRPGGFQFRPGQSITLTSGSLERDYSLICGPDAPRLALCVRRVDNGHLSRLLAAVPLGSTFAFTGPHGYFTYRDSPRKAVFAATGTGMAPFIAMVRAGARGFTMLHGVRTAEELYYKSEFLASADRYVACLSEGGTAPFFAGRVTDWAREHLSPGSYDFYLCGNRQMIRDLTLLVDERFPGSFVYSEVFH
jgi:benzoate/toluate 1,2-dioxygenase reductase subunit